MIYISNTISNSFITKKKYVCVIGYPVVYLTMATIT